MKHFYLALALASAAFLPAGADVLNFGYCTDEITGIGHNREGVEMAAAIKIPAELAQRFAGNKITTVSIGFAQSTPKRVTIFLTRDLAGEPFYTQLANLKVNRFNDVPLTTPFEFDGEDLYIGYKITTTSPSDYPVGVDNFTLNVLPEADNYSSNVDGNPVSQNWTHLGELHGNIALRVFVDGPNLDAFQNSVRPLDAYAPAFVQTGRSFDGSISFQNTGVRPVESVALEYSIAGQAPVAMDITLPEPLAGGKCTKIELPKLLVSESGDNLPFSVIVKKVNGEENQADNPSVTRTFSSSPFMTNRTMVVEEGTGQWCGYCVRGYVALENMREAHKDGSYIGIAVHNRSIRGPQADVMHCDSYQDFISTYITGFPKATANRKYIFDPNPNLIGTYYNAITELPANILVDAKASFTDETKRQIEVTVDTRSLQPLTSHNYGLSLVVTEDNVGPYYQENFYAGGSMGKMGGFENMPNKALVTFNDVAREIHNWRGDAAYLPSAYDPEQTYTKTLVIPTPSSVENPDNLHVVAMVIDMASTEIENASKASVSDQSGISLPTGAGRFQAVGTRGELVVFGQDVVSFDVFDMQGRKVASLEGAGAVVLPAGLYAVSATTASGRKSAKVAVR